MIHHIEFVSIQKRMVTYCDLLENLNCLFFQVFSRTLLIVLTSMLRQKALIIAARSLKLMIVLGDHITLQLSITRPQHCPTIELIQQS